MDRLVYLTNKDSTPEFTKECYYFGLEKARYELLTMGLTLVGFEMSPKTLLKLRDAGTPNLIIYPISAQSQEEWRGPWKIGSLWNKEVLSAPELADDIVRIASNEREDLYVKLSD